MIENTTLSTRKKPSDWGMEVKKRLLDRNIQQIDIVKLLNDRGYKINRLEFSNLIYGRGAGTRSEIIAEISKMLDIHLLA